MLLSSTYLKIVVSSSIILMNFKDITIEDKKILDKYIKPYTFKTSEYSFISLYIWRKAYHIQYAISKYDALIIMKKDEKGNYHFMQPIGYKDEDLENILEECIDYMRKNNMIYLFKDAEEDFAQKLNHISKKFIIKEERENFDYIYESEKLISLSGKKLHSKRNHINSFLRNYEPVLKPIDKNNADEVNEMAKYWCKQNFCVDYLYFELKGVQDMLCHLDELDFQGMAIYVNGRVEGFTFGEKVNEKMAIIHIEKANADLDGLYAYINNAFVKNYFYDVPFINREEDLGIEGLRKAKLSYQPYKLERKFIVTII